jgi:cell division protease FtsH
MHNCVSSSGLVPAGRWCPVSARRLGALGRGAVPRAFFGSGAKESPPKPNSKFKKADLKRIKQTGPTMEDLRAHFEVKKTSGSKEETRQYDFVPYEVLGSASQYQEKEPNWKDIPQMSYMEFYAGLRERNWTSEHYNPDAGRWQVQFFQDSGRFLRPTFAGYRALIKMENGGQGGMTTKWVNLDRPGPDTFLRDYMGGGTPGGAIFKSYHRRHPQKPFTPGDYGYNQVFEQLFEAYEQRLSAKARLDVQKKGWTNRAKGAGYDCPADRHLNISFNLTPPERSLHAFWELLPTIAFYGFGMSFLGVVLAIGIFRPRKQMPTDMFQAMEFAQSKGTARKDGQSNIKFADVGGLGETIHEMMDVVSFLKDPVKYAALDARPPKGILLSGDPGVGKTLIAKAMAGEAGVPFYQMAGSEFVEAIVGVGAARVRDLFRRARAQAPCIVFVDEIDALGIQRAAAGVKTNEEREQTLNQLLSEMDGFKPDSGVVFVAATNRPDLLDSALVRAGRFDRKIVIRRPDEAGRKEILQIHARRHKISSTVDLGQLAKDLPGLSGAELGNVLNEAALEAVRRDATEIHPEDVFGAVDRVLQGIRRPSLPDRFAIKKSMAIHEAGTAIVAMLLHKEAQRIEAVERVSIVPRGRDWSRTIYARGDDEDYIIMTKGRILDRIKVILAGRAAEEVHEGVPSTYGTNDIRDATKLAIRYVANYALDTEVGITTYAPTPGRLGFMQKSFEVAVDNIDEDLFGNTIAGGSFQPSDNSWHEIKSKAATIVKDAYKTNLDTLIARKEAMDTLAELLLEKETVFEKEIRNIIDQYQPKSDIKAKNASILSSQ